MKTIAVIVGASWHSRNGFLFVTASRLTYDDGNGFYTTLRLPYDCAMIRDAISFRQDFFVQHKKILELPDCAMTCHDWPIMTETHQDWPQNCVTTTLWLPFMTQFSWHSCMCAAGYTPVKWFRPPKRGHKRPRTNSPPSPCRPRKWPSVTGRWRE